MLFYIFDKIHGDIEISPLAKMFIDTQEFQRLRLMKQLGPSVFVYPSAESSRFSHSLGVGHLALLVGRHLKNKYPDIVDDRTIDLLNIAGFIHDIGHGPFSHAFDLFVESSLSPLKVHEERSKVILKYMVKKYQIPLDKDEIQFICDTFDPSDDKKRVWKYQIISGDVDVDRMDYLIRDSNSAGIPVSINIQQIRRLIRFMKIKDNRLCFDPKAKNIIKCLFSARRELFTTVYKHKTSIAIENILKIIFQKVSNCSNYNIEKMIENENIEDFLKIDDSILQNIFFNKTTTDDVKDLINQIYSRTFDKKIDKWSYIPLALDIKFE